MPVELALALAGIATRTPVAELVRGAPMNRDGWAVVAADVVDTLISTPTSRAPAPDRFQQFGERVEQLAGKIDELPVHGLDLRMATGRRFLRDLPAK